MTYLELQNAFPNLLDETKIETLKKYCSLLLEANQKFNLTAIKSEPEVIEKHFYDSILPAKLTSFDGKRICDIGTGAGFPGMVWAILFPKGHFVLVDSTGKKCTFLRETSKALGLDNVEVIQSRAEELNLKESFDYTSARALGDLRLIMELTAPLLKVGGRLVAMRGFKGLDEMKLASKAMKELGLKVETKEISELPGDIGKRINILYIKINSTPNKYPRRYDEIVKRLL